MVTASMKPDLSGLFDQDSKSLNTAPPEFIPVIDMSAFTIGSGDKEATAQQLVQAFAHSGFVYLKNHGIPKEMSADMFALSREFFDKELEYKARTQVMFPKEESKKMSAINQRKLSELDKVGRAEEIRQLKQVNPDLKESFEIGREDPLGPHQNKFPSDWPEFKEKSNRFFEQMNKLHQKVMLAIAMGLGLKQDYFDDKIDKADNTLRLLRYPQVPIDAISETTRRAGAHCDYGSITLLLQDGSGGLEVYDKQKDEFVKATPLPDTIIVNVADMLMRWSNDCLKSTLHRVVKPYVTDKDTCYPARYSIAYFCNPNYDYIIDTLPTWQVVDT